MTKALVVDDDRVTLTVMVRTIEDSGFACLTAASGEEAMEVLAANKDDVVVLITDLRMPDMDGVELFQHAKQIREDLRGILCSGHVSYSSINEYIKAGFDDVIGKPIDGPNLVQAIRRAMDKQGRWKRRSHPNLRAIND